MLLSALSATGGEVYDSGWSSTASAANHRQVSPPTRHAFKSMESLRSPQVGKIKLAAYEDETPTTGAAHRGRASLRSIVVKDGGRSHSYRVAQETFSNDDLLEGFSQPFGEEEAPGIETPATEEHGFGDPSIAPLPPLEEPPLDIETPSEPDIMEQPLEPEVIAPSPSDEPRVAPGDLEPGYLEDVKPQDLNTPGLKMSDDDEGSVEYRKAMKNCAEELAELKASRIAEIDLHILPTGSAGEDYPYECGIDDGTPFVERSWPQVCYMWKASALCHKPLYFENVQLERYGHSWGPFVQPLVSGAHFFTRIPVLPYCMGLKAPNECVYTLGHYRPGNCAPYLIEAIPFTKRAAMMQSAAVTGAVFVFP